MSSSSEVVGTLASGGTYRATSYSVEIRKPDGEIAATFDLSLIDDVSRTGQVVTLLRNGQTVATITAASLDDAGLLVEKIHPSPHPGSEQPVAMATPSTPATQSSRSGRGCIWWIGASVVAVIVGCVGLVIIGAIVGGLDDADDDQPSRSVSRTRTSSSSSSSSRATSTPAPSGVEVTYRVTHSRSTGGISLTYENSQGGTEQQDTNVSGGKWEKRYQMDSFDFAYISVQNQEDSGTVTCEILLDGRSWKKSSSTGAYVIATCSDLIP